MEFYFFIPTKNHASPYINHFLQPDSIISDYTNPQTLNRYSYVGNRPVNFNDPTGHCPEEMPECRKILSDLLPKPEGGGGNGGDGKDDDRLKDLNGQAQKDMASCIQSFGLDCGNPVSPPSTTGTPTPYTGPAIRAPINSTPDWEFPYTIGVKDSFDLGVDIAGIIGDGASALGVTGKVVWGLTEGAELIGIGKDIYDLALKKDASGISSTFFFHSAEKLAPDLMRMQNPGIISFAGNIWSISQNITITPK